MIAGGGREDQIWVGAFSNAKDKKKEGPERMPGPL
jgi:hypothetical protein